MVVGVACGITKQLKTTLGLIAHLIVHVTKILVNF